MIIFILLLGFYSLSWLTNNPLFPDLFVNSYKYSSIEANGNNFDVVKVKPEKTDLIEFYYRNANNQKISSINNLRAQTDDLVFAMNGGIFSEDYQPLGLYIENKERISDINLADGEGNFYLKPNGVFAVEANGSKIIASNSYRDNPEIINALQSGPLLVLDGQINSAFSENSKNKYVRNGVGVDQNGNTIFVISNEPVTFYEFASFFKEEMKSNNALYLDGAISEMYVDKHREDTIQKFSVMIGINKS